MSEELPIQAKPCWFVRLIPLTKKQTQRQVPQSSGLFYGIDHPELVYRRRQAHKTAITSAGIQTLHEIASFSNRRGFTPRPSEQCAADAASPDAYLKKHQSSKP